MVGQAYRYRFLRLNLLFISSVASLIVPNILISLGIGVLFNQLGWTPQVVTPLDWVRISHLDAALCAVDHDGGL